MFWLFSYKKIIGEGTCSLWRAVLPRGRCGFVQVPPFYLTLRVTSSVLMGPDVNPGDGNTARRFLFTKVILLLETVLFLLLAAFFCPFLFLKEGETYRV